MKYAVDRIIEDVAVLEHVESGEIIEVNKKILPGEVHEGSIVIKQADNYILCLDDEKKRKENLRERLERLKNLKK